MWREPQWGKLAILFVFTSITSLWPILEQLYGSHLELSARTYIEAWHNVEQFHSRKKKGRRTILGDQVKVIEAQTKAIHQYKENFRRHEEYFRQINSQLDQIIESQITYFQKLQMCAPINYSTQPTQRESVWDNEDTFGQNDKVTFEL